MRKLLLVTSIMFVLLVFGNTANALSTVTDTQDASNWGDWFIPDDADPYVGESGYTLSPYYRQYNEDWGWTHTVDFGPGPITIISATLEIEAWDVDAGTEGRLDEIDVIKGDGINLGSLDTGYSKTWHTTILNLDASALAALADGTLNIMMDIDSLNAQYWLVTLKKPAILSQQFQDLI